MKLRTMKGQMTRNMNKLEPAITAIEKAETEGGSATRIKSKAEDIKLYLDRLKSEENEMDTISSALKGVMCESEQDELGVTQEQSIDTLEEDIEKFLSRYEKLKEDKDDTLMRATERNNQSTAGPMPTALELSSYSL